ncbi:DUF2306 domain-containing protein [Rhodobacteraceae bacterium W635]|uniref:DUF2306 domain-containing protein n=1 Tax=Nioella halotolerans TaxID=2303578 RepID=UPI000E3EA217|nr:DUF2306 domain-containing protein [Rhodobacteraceae bacterium W635]
MTSFDPLFNAPLAVQLHVAGALPALLLTPVVLWRRRRDRLHRRAGYAWVLAMALTAASSFWITGFGIIGPFSPIHLLSVVTLVGLVTGVRAAIRGQHDGHRQAMTNMAWGLAAAGLLNFLPGRLTNRIVLDGAGWPGFALVVGLAACIAGGVRVLRRGSGANQVRP